MAAETIVRDVLQKVAADNQFEDCNITLTPVNSHGSNYTTNLFSAAIADKDKKLSVFAKIAAVGKKFRSDVPIQIYKNERFFYTELTIKYRELEERKGVAEEYRIRFPKFYGCREELYQETIVMEDLTEAGYNTFNRRACADWHYAAAAISEIARYHALSVLLQKEEPSSAKEVFEQLKFDLRETEVTGKSWVSAMEKAMAAVRPENKERLQRYYDAKKIGTDAYAKLSAAASLPVVAHADYRPSNVMYKRRENGTVEVVPVDFQTLRSGSPVVDLLYFVFTGTDKAFRDQHYTQLVHHYYSELAAAMGRLGLKPEEIYPRETFDAELKEKLPFGLAVAVFTLPVVTVDESNAPQVNEDMDLSSFNVSRTSDLYRQRINEVVDDYVSWGVL